MLLQKILSGQPSFAKMMLASKLITNELKTAELCTMPSVKRPLPIASPKPKKLEGLN